MACLAIPRCNKYNDQPKAPSNISLVLEERKSKQTKEIAILVVGLQKVHVVNSHQVRRKTDRAPNEGFCGREFYLHSFLHSAFERGNRLSSCPGIFTNGKKNSQYPFNDSLGSPQGAESLTHRGQVSLHLPPGLALSKYKLS